MKVSYHVRDVYTPEGSDENKKLKERTTVIGKAERGVVRLLLLFLFSREEERRKATGHICVLMDTWHVKNVLRRALRAVLPAAPCTRRCMWVDRHTPLTHLRGRAERQISRKAQTSEGHVRLDSEEMLAAEVADLTDQKPETTARPTDRRIGSLRKSRRGQDAHVGTRYSYTYTPSTGLDQPNTPVACVCSYLCMRVCVSFSFSLGVSSSPEGRAKSRGREENEGVLRATHSSILRRRLRSSSSLLSEDPEELSSLSKLLRGSVGTPARQPQRDTFCPRLASV